MGEPHKHAKVPEERRAAEYLANERTFLAWIRTSISVISIGFVISRVGGWIRPGDSAHGKTSFAMGVGMMALGAVLSILAVWRYHVVNRHIDEGRVKADRGLVILVTALVVLLAAGMIVFMMANE